MGQLREEQAHHVAPRGERARLLVDPVLAREFGDEVRRDELAYLREHGQLGPGWFSTNHHGRP